MSSPCMKCVRRKDTNPREQLAQRGGPSPFSARDAKNEINQALF